MDVRFELQGSKVSSIPTSSGSYITHGQIPTVENYCSLYSTSFFAPKLLASMEAAESGSSRAVERGSDAAEIDRGSDRGSLLLVGGAEGVSFDPLTPFPLFAKAVSTDYKEILESTLRVTLRVRDHQLTVTMPIRG